MSLVKVQLKNGLKVMMIPDHKAPVVSVQMWVHNGSADEGKGTEGLSHFIEHLVFKGSRKFGPGEIAQTVEGSGGELNAYTSFDQTVFYVTISKAFTETALECILEMMGFPKFDSKEVDAEREVVIEEIKRGKDSPQRVASEMLFSTSFKKHPYGRPVIGFDKVVKGAPLKRIKDFYHSRYSPQNMFLVVAGDFPTQELKKRIQQMYSEIPRTPVSRIKRKKEPVQKSPRLKIETSQFKQAISYISWKVPKIDHDDHVALEVLALVLGQGDSSRLVHRLRLEQPLVNSVGAFSYGLEDHGIFAISFSAEQKNLVDIFPEVFKQIQSIRQIMVSNEEVSKAIVNLSAQEIYASETVNGIANKAGSQQFFYGNPAYHKVYLKKLAQITPKDLLRVAKKYLKKNLMSVTLLAPQADAHIKKAAQNFIRDFDLSNKKLKAPLKQVSSKEKNQAKKMVAGLDVAPKAKAATNATYRYETAGGMRVLVRPMKDTPLVSARIAFLGGARLAGYGRPGLAELASRCWSGGTEVRDEIQIAQETEAIAAGLGIMAGRNTLSMNADYLAKFEEPACDLMGDVLLNANFPSSILDREREIQLNQIKNKVDNPTQLASLEFLKLMFEGDTYAQDVLGDPQNLNLYSPKDLLDFKTKSLYANGGIAVIAGAADPDVWLKRLEMWEQAMGKKSNAADRVELKPLTSSRHHFISLDKEQSHLILGYRGLAVNSSERFVMDLLQSILAGQGGRLFMELRDKESLAYSVSPMAMKGLGGGYFGGYIACSPEKVTKARDLMVREFEKMATTLVPEDELMRSKRYLVGSHDIDLQRNSAISSAILFDEIYGNDSDLNFKVKDVYWNITAEQVRALAKKIFSGPSVSVVAGRQDLEAGLKP
jgi:zinc protease